MTTATDDLREELRLLGERRKRKDSEDAELTRQITEALKHIKAQGITKSDAARLLGVHRTTLYRVYNI